MPRSQAAQGRKGLFSLNGSRGTEFITGGKGRVAGTDTEILHDIHISDAEREKKRRWSWGRGRGEGEGERL